MDFPLSDDGTGSRHRQKKRGPWGKQTVQGSSYDQLHLVLPVLPSQKASIGIGEQYYDLGYDVRCISEILQSKQTGRHHPAAVYTVDNIRSLPDTGQLVSEPREIIEDISSDL